MRTRPFLCAAVALALAAGSGALPALPAEETKPDRVANLVAQLGDEKFAKREAASRALAKIGEPALAALRKAATSEDAEVRLRAARLVRVIEDALPVFNGKDLTGWAVESGDPKRWQVKQGALLGAGGGSDARGWLLTKLEYSNFLLTLEFQAARGADGAVGFRALPGEKEGRLPMHLCVKLTRYEKPLQHPQSGALYWRLNTWEQPAPPAKLEPEGKWNKLELQVCGREIRVRINGREVQKLSLDRFARQPHASPGLGRSTGRIGLQHHTGEIRFRKIEVKVLP